MVCVCFYNSCFFLGSVTTLYPFNFSHDPHFMYLQIFFLLRFSFPSLPVPIPVPFLLTFLYDLCGGCFRAYWRFVTTLPARSAV